MLDGNSIRTTPGRRLRRLIVESASKGQGETSETPSGSRLALRIVALSAWFGLVAGLIEVASLWFMNAKSPGTYLGQHEVTRHFWWMVPLTQMAIFSVGGLVVLAPLSLVWRRKPERAWMWSVFALVVSVVYAVLGLIDGVYKVGALALGVGVASQVAPLLVNRPRFFRRLVRISTPVFLGVVGLLAFQTFEREVWAEARAAASLPAARPDAPNVLLVVLDTVSAEHLSLYGYARPTTPRLEALAKRGVTFEMARSPASWTLPAHASIFTGRWPHELHVGTPTQALDETYPTLAEFFAKQGYYTAGFAGNTYYCGAWFGVARGFQHYEDFYEQGMDVSVDSAARSSALGRQVNRLLRTNSYNIRDDLNGRPKDAEKINQDFGHWLKTHSDRPFFAFLNYYDAHDPYIVPSDFHRHLGRVPKTAEERERIRKWADLGFLNSHDLNVQPDPLDLQLNQDAYDDCLAALDARLGQLFEALERQGVLQNTVVVVTADHGEEFGGHRLFGHGISLYRPEVHVPLLIVKPGATPGGRRVREPVSTRNIAATLSDLAGVVESSPFPGRSLAEYWDDSKSPAPRADDEIVSIQQNRESKAPEFQENLPPGHLSALTSLVVEDKVYIRDDFGYEELYDLWTDPEEKTNLSRYPEMIPVLERCRRTWGELWTRRSARPFYDVSNQGVVGPRP